MDRYGLEFFTTLKYTWSTRVLNDTDENLEFDDLQFLTFSLLKLRILKARATVIDKTLEMTKQ